jgi:hypothetical protein
VEFIRLRGELLVLTPGDLWQQHAGSIPEDTSRGKHGLPFVEQGVVQAMIEYLELAGSPVEEFSAEGFRARRFFLVPWEKRTAFAEAMLGHEEPSSAELPTTYPGRPDVRAGVVRITPDDAESVRLVPEDRRPGWLASYPGSFARVEVEYELARHEEILEHLSTYRDRQISHRLRSQPSEHPLPASGWIWQQAPQIPLAADHPLVLTVPVTEHTITIRTATYPNWETIAELQGKVNSQSFLCQPAETLLFLGVTASKLYRGRLDAGPSPFAWELRFTFLQRAIKHGGRVFGWNHQFRPDLGTWDRPLAGGHPLYEAADFELLLQQAP